MSDRWIMDVLADLRSFARANELPQLAEQLDHVTTVAALELANRPQGKPAPERAVPAAAAQWNGSPPC